jgi:osmotically-inducible protein OsmY
MSQLYRLGTWILFYVGLSACTPVSTFPNSSVFEDEHIEKQAIAQIKSRHIVNAHVNVTCFNRRLLLTGEVPNETTKSEIEKIVSGVANVKVLSNELVVGETRGIASFTADSLIMSDVKFRFLKYGSFQPSHIKIMAEDATVFLMGKINRKEASSAAELASTTKGVRQVILLFDYLD